MRDSKAALSALLMPLLSLVVGAGTASAQCRVCDPFLHCTEQAPGARLCVESPGVCSMLLPCLVGGGGRVSDDSEEGLLTVSLFDAVGAVTPALETGAGPLDVGAGARGSSGQAQGRLGAALVAYGHEYAVWFADAADGGFAVKRAVAGGAVQVEVLEVSLGVPGRVLASALLLPHDRLRVAVRVDGRERVLVVQATEVARGRLAAEQVRLRRALESAGREIGEEPRPLLDPRPL